MTGEIFISYRRDQDAGFAGRLYDRLANIFTSNRIFMDVSSIRGGEDFVSVLLKQVSECSVFLVLIGQEWLRIADESGEPRLHNPADFVRIEIGSSLAHGKHIIPVLLGQAAMPSANELPDDISALARRSAVRLTHEHFNPDAERLIQLLHVALGTKNDEAIAAERKRDEEETRRRHSERLAAEEVDRRGKEDRKRQLEAARQKAEAEKQEAEKFAKRTAENNKKPVKDENKICPTCKGCGRVRVQQGFFTIEEQCPTCSGVDVRPSLGDKIWSRVKGILWD